jgi:ankyrin repeat protein
LKSNESLLHYACRYGHIDIVKYLIKNQHMNPIMRDNINQLEPLDYAVNNKRYPIAVYLCQNCISSDEMLSSSRIKTTINLIKYIISRAYRNESLIWKTANEDNILQLVGSSETCIAHIPSAVVSEILGSCNPNYIIGYFKPDLRTADGDTILKVVCKSRKVISQIPSTVLTKWLSASNELIKIDILDGITADGDNLLELICQSKKFLIQISSTVFLKWLRKNILGSVTIAIPDCKTADGDTLLQLILRSEVSISQISSQMLAILLSNSRKITMNEMKNVNPNWKTVDGAHFPHVLCLSTIENYKIIELMQYYILMNGWNPDISDSEGNTVLHIACQINKFALVRYLVNQAQCNLNMENRKGSLSIDMATSLIVIKYLLQHDQVSVSSKTIIKWMKNLLLIDNATIMRILQSLVDNHKTITRDGSTLLHVVCTCSIPRDKKILIDYLLTECQCDPNCLDSKGQMPLQLTSDSEIMKILVKHGAKVTTDVVFSVISSKHVTESRAVELLALSSRKGTMLWHLTDLNRNGETALDLAYTLNKPAVVNYLLTEVKCDPSANNLLNSLLELTTNLNVAELLIKHGARATPELVLRFEAMEASPNKGTLLELMLTTWNPDDRDSDGYTALHLACKADRPTTVNLLLSVAHCDPNIKSSSEEVPLQMITNTEIIKDLIRHGAKTSIMYKSYKKALGTNKPLQPPVKVFVVGNPSVGKSTLTAALKTEKGIIAQFFSSGKVSGVGEKTVGIVPHDLESGYFGRVTLYDFAGHREFYSGHAALLQTAIQSTPPIFLLVVNLSEDDNKIIKNILYWILFLENQCASVTCRPHIILVGSHADALKGVNPKDKVKTVSNMLDEKCFINIEYIGFVAMNCQFHESTGMSDLRRLLIKSCQELRIKEPITFNAHCFLVYLIDKFINLTAVMIKTASATIENQQSKEGVLEFLPTNFDALYKICLELNDRSHILLLKDRIAVENSYVVIDKTFLLSEISGTVFAPEGFTQYTQLSTNSGVVPRSKLADSFPGKDLNIVIGFLSHLEFCHEIVDQALYQLISKEYSHAYDGNERYYLFPGLVSMNAEDSVWKTESHFEHNFGWTLKCINDEQFFSSRFLQVLLLRLAFSFALKVSGSDHTFGIHRKCSIWKNGIFWGRNFNMDVLVEVTDNKSVTLIARFGTSNLLKSINQRSEVILTILECVKQFCPRVETIESFIDSSSALQYPLDLNSDRTLCSVRDLSEALVSSCECPSVVLSDSGKSIPAESLLSFEPYSEMEPQLLQELWDKDNESKKIFSDTFLSKFVKKSSSKPNWFVKIVSDSASVPSNKDDLSHELIKWRDNKKTYKEFRHSLDQYSVFAGRNILVGKKDV